MDYSCCLLTFAILDVGCCKNDQGHYNYPYSAVVQITIALCDSCEYPNYNEYLRLQTRRPIFSVTPDLSQPLIGKIFAKSVVSVRPIELTVFPEKKKTGLDIN